MRTLTIAKAFLVWFALRKCLASFVCAVDEKVFCVRFDERMFGLVCVCVKMFGLWVYLWCRDTVFYLDFICGTVFYLGCRFSTLWFCLLGLAACGSYRNVQPGLCVCVWSCEKVCLCFLQDLTRLPSEATCYRWQPNEPARHGGSNHISPNCLHLYCVYIHTQLHIQSPDCPIVLLPQLVWVNCNVNLNVKALHLLLQVYFPLNYTSLNLKQLCLFIYS